jgi:hypothetical protein
MEQQLHTLVAVALAVMLILVPLVALAVEAMGVATHFIQALQPLVLQIQAVAQVVVVIIAIIFHMVAAVQV